MFCPIWLFNNNVVLNRLFAEVFLSISFNYISIFEILSNLIYSLASLALHWLFCWTFLLVLVLWWTFRIRFSAIVLTISLHNEYHYAIFLFCLTTFFKFISPKTCTSFNILRLFKMWYYICVCEYMDNLKSQIRFKTTWL